MKVYLAGPIKGTHYHEATGWRDYVSHWLEYQLHAAVLNPMRGHEQLKGTVVGDEESDHPFRTPAGVFRRDQWMVDRADVILVNLLGADQVSIGTMVELGWASGRYPKPLVVVVMEDGGVHDHWFVRAAADFVIDNMEDALEIVRRVE